MSKRIQAKYKIDRRMGENLWGRPKSPVNRREYGPGQHGQGRRGKISDFGIHLRAKQKLKGYYGNITEKGFRRNVFEVLSAARMRNTTPTPAIYKTIPSSRIHHPLSKLRRVRTIRTSSSSRLNISTPGLSPDRAV